MKARYIIVDDDRLNNRLCTYTIKKIVKAAEINCFQLPLQALDFISRDYSSENAGVKTLLLLDINMPELNGWEFLEEFSKMQKQVQDQFTIYIVSSSIDPVDKEKAAANPLVKDYIIKPLNLTKFKGIIESNQK